MPPWDIKRVLPTSEKAAWELEELLVRIVVQDSLTSASDTPVPKAASAFQQEHLEKAQLELAIEESRLEASRAQRRLQENGQREQIEVQQAIAASLTEATTTRRRRRRDRDHNDEAADVQQASEASLRATTNTRPRSRELGRRKRVKVREVIVESHTETTTTRSHRGGRGQNEPPELQEAIDASLKKATSTRPHRRERDRQGRFKPQQASVASLRETTTRPHRDLKRDRSKLEQLEPEQAIDASLRETTNKRPRHTVDALTGTNNTETRPRHSGHSRLIPCPPVPRTWDLPTRPADPIPRLEIRVAVDRPSATGRPMERTRAPDPRLERTHPANPRPDKTPAASRPAERPRPVDPRRDRTPATRRPVDRSRNVDRPPNPTANKTVNRPVEAPQAAPNPAPEPRPALEVPPTAAQIYRWLRTREGPRPVARCFGACPHKLVFRGLQSDNGRREPSITLGCGHVVGGKCFSDLVDMAKAEGQDAPCPHCLIVPTSAAV